VLPSLLLENRKLQELLPRLQGAAGDFTFDQLQGRTLLSYTRLVKELGNRFGVYESRKNYKVLFNRRNQRAGETPEMYAAELKHIYDKAYAHRASIIRQEDLLQRFLMGLEDNKARVHIELNKDPKTIEEAVQEVIAYIEATSYPKTEDIYYNGRNKRVRQVKRNTLWSSVISVYVNRIIFTKVLPSFIICVMSIQFLKHFLAYLLDFISTKNFRNKGTLCSAIIAASQVILHEVATVTQIDNPIVIGLTDNQTDHLKDMSIQFLKHFLAYLLDFISTNG
jgi:hypothetical protein